VDGYAVRAFKSRVKNGGAFAQVSVERAVGEADHPTKKAAVR